MNRTRRAELLAAAERTALVDVAEGCLAGAPAPVLVAPPEVGMVMMTVREPVEATRFHLGEVLVTRAEVEHRAVRGWSMRMGDDPEAALAAAVCDAEIEADGPARRAVETLCVDTETRLVAERDAEWSELAPTVVDFEEMTE